MARIRTQKKGGTQHQAIMGQATRREFGMGAFLRSAIIRVTGNLVVSGGSVNGTLVNQGILNLIREISVEGDGKAILKSSTPKMLWEKARIWNQVAPRQVDPAVGVGTNPFSFEIPIFFETIYQRPDEYLVNTNLYRRLEHVINWSGDVSSIIKGGDRTESLSAVVANIMTYETLKARPSAFGIHRDYVVERTVEASSERFQIKMNTGNTIPFLMLASYDQDTNGDDVAQNDIINSVRIVGKSGAVYFERLDWEMLRADNLKEAGILPSDGYAFINPVEEGLLSSAFVTRVNDELILEMDVTKGTNTTTVRVGVTEMLDPVEVAQG